MDEIGFAAAAALGATLIVSGTSKLRDPGGFILGVLEYDLLPSRLAVVYARLLPPAELLCGVALVFGVERVPVGIVAVALLISFSVAVGASMARGRRLACHCFGSRNDEPIGWTTVARLCVLLICGAAAITWPGGGPLSVSTAAAPSCLLAVALVVALYLLPVVPQTRNNWLTRGEPAATLNGGRVSLRDLPLEREVGTGASLGSGSQGGEL